MFTSSAKLEPVRPPGCFPYLAPPRFVCHLSDETAISLGIEIAAEDNFFAIVANNVGSLFFEMEVGEDRDHRNRLEESFETCAPPGP